MSDFQHAGADLKSSSSPDVFRSRDSPDLDLPAPKRSRMSGPIDVAAPATFKAGALVRMRMRNFMTYDDISYEFGPALNMIIGPNGSGKSTVVAGICIGLGFDPKIMGRADKVEATIKHGQQSAEIEIELKGEPGSQNVMINRLFGHGMNGGKGQNEWQINGKRTTHKMVQELVRGFRCQIDNLCQFLPQDRVASFARMKPVEMLAETLRTIGDGSLGEVQDKLIELQGKHVSETSTRKTDEGKLKGLKARQEVLERDVARFKEREEFKRDIYIREKRLPFASYNEAKDIYTRTKDDYAQAKARLLDLRQNNQPLELQEGELMETLSTAEKTASKIKARLDRALRNVEATASPLRKAEDIISSLELKYKEEAKAEKDNKLRIRELREKVTRESRSLGEAPQVEEKLEELVGQIKALNSSDRDSKAEFHDLQEYLKGQQSDRMRSEEEINQKEKELSSLDDVRSKRYQLLKQRNQDAADAIRWLERNGDRFEHRVFGPVLLEVQVTNEKYARAAQHVIMQNAFTFTCQSRQDYQTFNNLLVDGTEAGRRLRLNVAEYSRTSAPHLRDQRSPLSSAEVKQYGLDGYLLDCLDGPDAVLNTLCHAAQIHALPIGMRNLSQEEIHNIENAAKNGRPIFQRYILNDTDTKIFRGYGQTSSESQAIHNNGSVFSHVIDLGRKKQLEGEIHEIRETVNGNISQLQKKNQRYNELKQELNETAERKKAINYERQELLKRKTNWQTAQTKVEQSKKELDRLENAPADYQDNMAAIRAEQVDKTASYTELGLKYKEEIIIAQDLYEKHIVAASAMFQAQANSVAFEAHNQAIQAELKDADDAVQAGKLAKEEALRKAQAVRRQATEAVSGLSEEEKDLVSNYDPSTTVEELELQIEDLRNRMSFLAETDGDVLGNYEARAQEIRELEENIQNKDAILEALAQEIALRRTSFETELEEMRSKIDSSFGEAFRSIQCLGEIRIGKPEDFASWSLEIWVQFRDTDSLQMLTGERQSGGERSVSTIFYLMALQSLSIAPFRVVDEINQGMDPRNERRVHARMVAIACRTATSQYFLITPKLLTDLDYHQNMKVHCVTSGNLGRSGNKIGYSKYLSALRTRKAMSQGGYALPQTQAVA